MVSSTPTAISTASFYFKKTILTIPPLHLIWLKYWKTHQPSIVPLSQHSKGYSIWKVGGGVSDFGFSDHPAAVFCFSWSTQQWYLEKSQTTPYHPTVISPVYKRLLVYSEIRTMSQRLMSILTKHVMLRERTCMKMFLSTDVYVKEITYHSYTVMSYHIRA